MLKKLLLFLLVSGCTAENAEFGGNPLPEEPQATADAACSGICAPSADLAQTLSPDLAVVKDGGVMSPARLCDATPPSGAALAPAPPRYAGTCPTLVAGKNNITTSGHARSFLLAVPAMLSPSENLPLVFLWHWLGGSSDEFYRKGEVQAAVDSQRFLAIIPDAKADMIFKWPFDVGVSAARQEEEYRFFDDMLACAAAQFHVNKECVSSAGVSAGALFTDQLIGGRGQYLSSALSLSGGVGGFVKPFGTPAHKMPMIVLWGGDKDSCFKVINFSVESKNLETGLLGNGQFFLECIHNCGHAEPPFDAPPGLSKYAALWQFVFDHPYWLRAGDSPYKTTGIPSSFPAWCGIGKGSATPRTGDCPNPPGC